MYTILSITIIIALAMACCFLYAMLYKAKAGNDFLAAKLELYEKITPKYCESLLTISTKLPYKVSVHKHGSAREIYASWDIKEPPVPIALICTFDTDDEGYNQRCAEELLDKLNE